MKKKDVEEESMITLAKGLPRQINDSMCFSNKNTASDWMMGPPPCFTAHDFDLMTLGTCQEK